MNHAGRLFFSIMVIDGVAEGITPVSQNIFTKEKNDLQGEKDWL
jgi:hypothetical protein